MALRFQNQRLTFAIFAPLLALSACTGFLNKNSSSSDGADGQIEDLPQLSLTSSQLDFSELDRSYDDYQRITYSGDGTAASPITIQMREYAAGRKIRFVDLPDQAELVCDGTSGNPAVQTWSDSEKTLILSANYWGLNNPLEQDFTCFIRSPLALASDPIYFRAVLNESPLVCVNRADQKTGPYFTSNYLPMISGDGKFLAFESDMADIMPAVINELFSVFVKEISTGALELISKSSAGAFANGGSSINDISSDGRYIVFHSYANNLVANDTNALGDIFVRDRQTQLTTRVSVSSAGVQAGGFVADGSISADGRYVVFTSGATSLVLGDANSRTDVFLHDRSNSTTTLVSVDSNEVQGANHSQEPSISADGAFVVFSSTANNLVASDTNIQSDVFLRDIVAGTTTRISVDSSEAQVNGQSNGGTINADGKFVVFQSEATNLVPGDSNGNGDVFVRDLVAGTTSRVSVDSSGNQGDGISSRASISSTGSHVAFLSGSTNLVTGDSNGENDVFVRDLQASTTARVSVNSMGVEANGASTNLPTISTDGRFIAFTSIAGNLVSGDTNSLNDLFVHDRQNATTARLSTDSSITFADDDTDGLSLSADGRYIAYESSATNLIFNDTNDQSDIFVHDRQSGTNTRISVSSGGSQADDRSGNPVISAEGRFVAFHSRATNLVGGDTNGAWDTFLHDRETHTTIRISESALGVQADNGSGNFGNIRPAISADGRYVAFDSTATNLVVGDTNGHSDIFLYDNQTESITLVSVDSNEVQSNAICSGPTMSADGRFVAFHSIATNLVGSDTNTSSDIFRRDTVAGTTIRVSTASGGAQVNNGSFDAALSSDGNIVAFDSYASNLVAGDTNNDMDIFVKDVQLGTTQRVSVSSAGVQANSASNQPAISADGRLVIFVSSSNNLVPSTSYEETYVYDRQSSTITRVSETLGGVSGTGDCYYSAISGDGRYAAFICDHFNLTRASPYMLNLFVRAIAQ